MKFEKIIPIDILKPYIHYFIVSEGDENHTYKVLPDTSMVMGFQYKGKLSFFSNHTEQPLSTAGITGIQDTFRLYKNLQNTGTILVYFKDAGASFFFKNPLNELFSESLSLDNFIRQSVLDSVKEQLAEAQTDLQRIYIVETFLMSLFRPDETDKLVSEALRHIYRSKGSIRIYELAKTLHTSQSPLEKRFRKIVGASPKKFASVVRLRAILNLSAKARNLTELAYEAGYFDQSHFTRDFKLLTGDTPEKYFNLPGK